jgi:hypothetical protein
MVVKASGYIGLTITFALLLAACASGPVYVVSPSTNLTLACTGSFDVHGYPYSKLPTGQATVYVVMNKDPSMTQASFDATGETRVICDGPHNSGATCNAQQDVLFLSVSSTWPGGDNTTLRLDKRTGKLSLATADYDGSWEYHGICKPLKSRHEEGPLKTFI